MGGRREGRKRKKGEQREINANSCASRLWQPVPDILVRAAARLLFMLHVSLDLVISIFILFVDAECRILRQMKIGR
jgi:hypothetical protein